MNPRVTKLLRIRKRQQALAVAAVGQSQQRELVIESELERAEQRIESLAGQVVSTLDLEVAGETVEHLQRQLAQTREDTAERRAVAANTAAAEYRAQKLYDRAARETARDAARHQQRTQDDRRHGEPTW